MAETLRYVIVTPARNEEQFIELTVRSMIAQTVLPLRWVIVSDGSTDRTDEIVRLCGETSVDRTGSNAGASGEAFRGEGTRIQRRL